jgi:hypothetical protein
MNDDIKALIERGSEVSLLREGAHGSTVRAVSYPEHEHTSLTNKGKRVQTHLNMMLTSRKVDLKHIPEADRSRIREQKTNALKITFSGTQVSQAPLVDWETTHKTLEPLAVQHVKECLANNKNTTACISKLLTSEPSYAGDFSISIEKRQELKLQTLCMKIISDNPYEPGADENDAIREMVFGEMQISAIPIDQTTLNRYQVNVNNYKVEMLSLRDMINHTYLRAIHEVSTLKAKAGIKECHQDFLLAQETAVLAPGASPTLFTARNIIDYIETKCLTDSAKRILACEKRLRALIRRADTKPLEWFEEFVQPLKAYKRALGSVSMTTEMEKEWKLHFANQISMGERALITLHREQYLITSTGTASSTLWNKVKKYLIGEFDLEVMKRLLTAMDKVFIGFIPDDTTLSYVRKHAKELEWDYKPDVRSLKEKERTVLDKYQKDDAKNKRSRKETKRDRNTSNPKSKRRQPAGTTVPHRDSVPEATQCKRSECRRRGTHMWHTHEMCKFKEGRSLEGKGKSKGKGKGKGKGDKGNRSHQQFVNLGRAKQKQAQPNKQNPSVASKEPCFLCKKPGCTQHKCFTCGGNHRKSDCPKQSTVNERLKNSSQFTSMMAHAFTKEQQACANRIINNYGETVCSTCMAIHQSGEQCSQYDLKIAETLSSVKQILKDAPDILDTVQQAHQFEDPPPNTDWASTQGSPSSSTTMLNTSFLAGSEGQEDMTCHECNEGIDFFENHTNFFANSGTTNPADWNTSSSLEPEEEQYQSDLGGHVYYDQSDGEENCEIGEYEYISQEDRLHERDSFHEYLDYNSQGSESEDY